jgi:hypothetical protein
MSSELNKNSFKHLLLLLLYLEVINIYRVYCKFVNDFACLFLRSTNQKLIIIVLFNRQ